MNDPLNSNLEVLHPETPSRTKPPAIANRPDTNSDNGKFRLHPVSGLLIILIDTLFFGGTVLSGGWALPLVCASAFAVTSLGVFLTQKFLSGDRFGPSLAKAFLSGVLAGVPTPISGTIFGTFVLASAGLKSRGKRKAPN